VLVALNLAPAPATVRLPAPGRMLLDTCGRKGRRVRAEVELAPATGAVIELDRATPGA
jgi:hypothetical protein